MARVTSGLLGLAMMAIAATESRAQIASAPTYLEYRADALFANGAALEGGVGAVIPMGVYVRTSVDGAAGVTWRDDQARASGRVDVISRFLLDPFREVPVGLSLGAGVSVPYASGDSRVRPYLVAVLDIEGRRRRRGITPALQVGFGGGTRVGVVLRTSPSRWR